MLPLVVSENTKGIPGDLCKPAGHALAKLQATIGAVPTSVRIEVRLTKLRAQPALTCFVMIKMYSNGNLSTWVTGSASVASTAPETDRSGTRDCVDAVIEDLMLRRVSLWLQAQARNSAAAVTPPVQPSFTSPTPTTPPTTP